jgi:hypothetical protein
MKIGSLAVTLTVFAVFMLLQTQVFGAAAMSMDEMKSLQGGDCAHGVCKLYGMCNAVGCPYPSRCNTCNGSSSEKYCEGNMLSGCENKVYKEGCGERLTNCLCLQSGSSGLCHDGASCDAGAHGVCDRSSCD